jgi:Mn2+/Fe2+ NRAMP family transporter
MLTGRREVMGIHVNGRLTTVLAWSCAIVIVALNLFLILRQFA